MCEENVEKVRQYFLKRLKVCDLVRATEEQISKDSGMSDMELFEVVDELLARGEIVKEYAEQCRGCKSIVGFYNKKVNVPLSLKCGECGECNLESCIFYKFVRVEHAGIDLEEALNNHLAKLMARQGVSVAAMCKSACCKARIFTELATPDMCKFICCECNKPCRGLKACIQCNGKGRITDINHFGIVEYIECSRCKGSRLEKDETGRVSPRKSV